MVFKLKGMLSFSGDCRDNKIHAMIVFFTFLIVSHLEVVGPVMENDKKICRRYKALSNLSVAEHVAQLDAVSRLVRYFILLREYMISLICQAFSKSCSSVLSNKQLYYD